MKTSDTIRELKEYLRKYIGCDVVLGYQDFTPAQYPIANILLEGEVETVRLNQEAMNIILSLSIEFKSGKDERSIFKLFDIYDDYCRYIGGFNADEGNENFGATANCVIGENDYTISTSYKLHITVMQGD